MGRARRGPMRLRAMAPLLLFGCGCGIEAAPPASLPDPLDAVWARTLQPGDAIVLVPGTGSHDYLAAPIEALADPVVDVRTNPIVASDAVVFEQALGAARRAGMTDAEIEAGAITFLLWGAGFAHLEHFDYISYDQVRMRVDVLGGENSCAVGFIEDNLLNYTAQTVDIDARDLYARLAAWSQAHPAERDVVVVAHSWGGAVAEYLALEEPSIEGTLGPMPTTSLPLTVAAGVPAFILGYQFLGPSIRDFKRPSGEPTFIYEIDRPDDPVHNMTFEGDYEGHRYNILIGSEFRGSYGITTHELSCHGVAGACM